MKTSERSKRLAGVLEEKIPPLLQQHCSPNQVGFLTVTAVEVAGDLSVADVFLSSIGKKNFLIPVQKVAPKIAYEVSQMISLRRPIKLRFREDKSVEATKKLNKLL